MEKSGLFLVSLDFELLWGVYDHETKESFHKQIVDARRGVVELLKLFDKYDVHATWATVGLIFMDDHTELQKYCPEIKPIYKRAELSAYSHFDQVGQNEEQDIYHYAGSLIRKILEYPNQEIGSHTFSHYYCKECEDLDAFREDLKSAKRIAYDKYGMELSSLILPRNQFSKDCAQVAAELGFSSIRGNLNSVYEDKNFLSRLIRIADTYFNVCGMKCYEKSKCIEKGFVNLRSSRFLRKYNKKLFFLEPLKISCIKRQMYYAAKTGRIFHIWWHPHNLGNNLEEFLNQVEILLKYYKKLSEKYGFISKNLAEAERMIVNENSNVMQ